ncbi:gCN5-related N-acetyltransferase [Tritrichomonas foetus]|uniref:GCN5-related N-acetyltransferase n=1 Tax=Tritrichomonas foetus TaxID=1144522 RepID=A0A1J4JEM3_9EUKA|nr:gCN5-related N-acetyltransferase [Tritrichomonas foetus]|eukprot:OHS97560.1 gCN5-related N-acetyltransferase [Tritrichomonas foetus]
MVKGEYEIFTCTKEEVKIVTDMAVAEGWTESYDAIDAIYNLDPEGYFVGKIDGKIVSSISAVRYPGNYGFIGFYIVLEEYRGKGYGIKIFKHAMEHLKGCLVCLDAVAQEVETYKRGGFVSSEGTDRYVGTSKILPVDSHIHAYDENSHFEEVAAYDEGCLPSQRKDFLREWLKIPHAKSVVYLDDNNRLQGYGSIHRTCHGWEIAPCYSENKEIAKCIMTP